MKGREFIIRDAEHDDLDKVMDMGESLQADSRQYEPELTFNRDQALLHYAAELKNNNAHITVAEHDGSIVGYQYSYIKLLDYLASKNRVCHIEALYVEVRSRGLGIAALLLGETERWAIEEHQVDRFQVGIYAGNTPSVRLHEKLGYEPYNIEYIKEQDT